MSIDASKIATAAAKAAARRHRGNLTRRSPAYDGATFQRTYIANGGDVRWLSSETREHEISQEYPDTQHSLASHHIREARRVMHWLVEDSPTIKEQFGPEYKLWCQDVAGWLEHRCDRLHPAFSALERLGYDQDGQFRHEFRCMLEDFNRALCSIDQRTSHLKGTARWQTRWREYKAEITDFYYDEWLPFMALLSEKTGVDEYDW